MILASHGIIGSQITQFVGLLDAYPNAAAAYSLRLLRSAYTGSAIRVRISTTGNPEYNIGFVDGELDVATLEGYCTGGLNAFVKTLYDQSGNARDATQTTAANQPQIVSSGSVILENGKPAIQSNKKRLFNTSVSTMPPTTDFFVHKPISLAVGVFEAYYDGGVTNDKRGYFGHNNINPPQDVVFDGTILTGNNSTTTEKVASILRNGSSSNFYYNGVLQASGNTGIYTILNGISFGTDYLGVNGSNLYYQEFIRYDSDQSSNRTGIETNIAQFYNISLSS